MAAKPLSIYEILRQEILDLSLLPGSELSEAEICTRFNASRTPVRTAMQRLIDDRLVEAVPYKGFRVSLLDADYIRQMVYLRTVMEANIIIDFIKLDDPVYIEDVRHQLSLQKILIDSGRPNPSEFYKLDSELHGLWFEKTGYPLLWVQIQQSEVYYKRFRMMDLVEKNSYQAIYEEHMKLFALITEKRASDIPSLMEYHFLGGFRRLKDLLSGTCRNYFSDTEDLDKFIAFLGSQKQPQNFNK